MAADDQAADDGAGEAETLSCGKCGRSGSFSAPVAMILVFAPGLERPYPLIPAEEYRVCHRCDAIFGLLDRAVEANAGTASAGAWTRAVVVFDDGQGLDVSRQPDEVRATQKAALA